MRDDSPPPPLSRLEVLGAWLGVWTPPRGATVPPVPWRRVAAGAAGLVVAAVLVAVLVAPAIDAGKDRRAASAARDDARRAAERRARQRAEQRPRTGRLAGTSARTAALVAVEAAIGRDARRRFSPRATAATCDPTPGTDPAAARVGFDCLSSVRAIVGAGDQEGARGELGIPYRAVLDFAAGTYAFCKLNPVPGEQVVPDPRRAVAADPACRVARR